MNAIPSDFPGHRPKDNDVVAPACPISAKWVALRDAAWAVATLAGAAAQGDVADVMTMPVGLDACTGMRRHSVEENLGDLVAVMEAGLSAILAAHDSGARPYAAARALWTEFVDARAGLQALVPLAGGAPAGRGDTAHP